MSRQSLAQSTSRSAGGGQIMCHCAKISAVADGSRKKMLHTWRCLRRPGVSMTEGKGARDTGSSGGWLTPAFFPADRGP